ncbi:uncharacterized protein C1orf127 homolog isoform X1 [Macrotis lagotis]|uniref:uncharacterized protein C1orf127 homolog isoform X1 n=1 Tax=Macrotis lagotis TaxID=92651 RepID=UPI003D687F05
MMVGLVAGGRSPVVEMLARDGLAQVTRSLGSHAPEDALARKGPRAPKEEHEGDSPSGDQLQSPAPLPKSSSGQGSAARSSPGGRPAGPGPRTSLPLPNGGVPVGLRLEAPAFESSASHRLHPVPRHFLSCPPDRFFPDLPRPSLPFPPPHFRQRHVRRAASALPPAVRRLRAACLYPLPLLAAPAASGPRAAAAGPTEPLQAICI